VKLALLKGNRFNPWHLHVYEHLRGAPRVSLFRADSEIQRYFDQRTDELAAFDIERIYFNTQAGNPVRRWMHLVRERYLDHEPRILPFHERLRAFDLIQTWELFTDWSAEALEAKRRFGMPVTVMVWDTIPFNMERNPERRRMKERVAAEADRFLVHTERSQRMLDIEGVSPERVVKVPVGIDLERFAPGGGNRTALGLADDEFVILFVGWLLPRKGVDFLILALRELIHDADLAKIKVRLAMVGSGPGRERVERLITRLGVGDRCTFLGSLPYGHMPDVYRCADAFVLPSIAEPTWQEQFGMSLIEAMACGTPVVATLSGAIREIAGDAAVLTQPNDFPALYHALKQLILEPARREDLAAAARARACDQFDLDAAANALSDVYDGLVR